MRYLFYIIFSLLSIILKSEFCVGIHGEVTDYFTGRGIKDVEVTLRENNKIIRSGFTLRKGFYAFELDSGKVYTIETLKEGLVSKKFIIETKNVICSDTSYYDMYLQITLFSRMDGFDYSLFQIPIAMASYKESIKNMSWETPYTDKIQPILDKTMDIYKKSVHGYYMRKNDTIPALALDDLFDTIPGESKPDVVRIVESHIENVLDPVNDTLDYNKNDSIFRVENSEGLFFTVQVGVYTKLTDLKKIYKIDDLNSELLPDGRIRYTSGRFIREKTANAYRMQVIKLGIKDAFITAYYKGKRIKITEALNLIDQLGPDILLK